MREGGGSGHFISHLGLIMQCHFDGRLLSQVLPPLLVLEITLGILGNGIALWIFCRHLKPWKSSTVLLFNLALADFLLLAALVFRLGYYINEVNWIFGAVICNSCLFMLALNRSGSAFFLMAIAVDRYMRVVHPHHAINSLSISKAWLGATVMWVVTILMTVHVLLSQHLIPSNRSDNRTYCESFMISPDSNGSMNWHKFEFLFAFYLPLLVILYCTVHIISHLRGRQLAQHAKIKKALCFITVVVVVFMACFLPSNIVQLIIWHKTRQLSSVLPPAEACEALDGLTSGFYISITLTYLNSGLDPVVYYFSSPTFKNICRKALHLPQVEAGESTAEKRTRETGSQSLNQL